MRNLWLTKLADVLDVFLQLALRYPERSLPLDNLHGLSPLNISQYMMSSGLTHSVTLATWLRAAFVSH